MITNFLVATSAEPPRATCAFRLYGLLSLVPVIHPEYGRCTRVSYDRGAPLYVVEDVVTLSQQIPQQRPKSV